MNFASLDSEKLSEYQVTQALAEVTRRRGVALPVYSLAPCWDETQPYYALFIESAPGTKRAARGANRIRPCSWSTERRVSRQAFQRPVGSSAAALATDGSMGGGDGERIARAGGPPEQYKHPCLIGDVKFGATMPVMGEPDPLIWQRIGLPLFWHRVVSARLSRDRLCLTAWTRRVGPHCRMATDRFYWLAARPQRPATSERPTARGRYRDGQSPLHPAQARQRLPLANAPALAITAPPSQAATPAESIRPASLQIPAPQSSGSQPSSDVEPVRRLYRDASSLPAG